MSAEPTRGNWTVAIGSQNEYWRGDGTEVMSEYGRIADCSVSGLRDLAECQANARLIAAAPRMLELLKRVIEDGWTGGLDYAIKQELSLLGDTTTEKQS